MTENEPRSSDQATASVDVDVDPKVAVAVAAWTTHIAARAVWTAKTETPPWIAMVLALMYDFAAQLDQTDAQPAGTAAKAGPPTPRGAAEGQGALVWGVLAERAASFLPADVMAAEPEARRALDELGAARLAVDAADTLRNKPGGTGGGMVFTIAHRPGHRGAAAVLLGDPARVGTQVAAGGRGVATAVPARPLLLRFRAGAKFENGVLVERPDESTSGDTHAA